MHNERTRLAQRYAELLVEYQAGHARLLAALDDDLVCQEHFDRMAEQMAQEASRVKEMRLQVKRSKNGSAR